MKPFLLQPKMLSLFNVFYPTGYIFAMFPTLEHAVEAERALVACGLSEQDILFVEPGAILSEIAATIDDEKDSLPSVGTESEYIRLYRDLARQGHCALMIPAASGGETELAMTQLRRFPLSDARRYHLLAIEALT
ncbi:RNA-binding protein [Chitinimonas arctica]|uniref:RNA-binding protein n=1 Tax=Chitinimonas arctica TaxID=2594795 RepID=A0A516SK15_9NEIS|nr:RNA-binding protein [Chitinimonas arctica]QDQ28473.1 RNA-binding protein [Chitinimonas arctica]